MIADFAPGSTYSRSVEGGPPASVSLVATPTMVAPWSFRNSVGELGQAFGSLVAPIMIRFSSPAVPGS